MLCSRLASRGSGLSVATSLHPAPPLNPALVTRMGYAVELSANQKAMTTEFLQSLGPQAQDKSHVRSFEHGMVDKLRSVAMDGDRKASVTCLLISNFFSKL